MDSPIRRQHFYSAIDDSSPCRPVPSSPPKLLPAFEPLSSPLPRAPKRKYDDNNALPKAELKYYPTPMPTSSTGVLPSSPTRQLRQPLQRTLSTLSERNPLCAVPSIEVPASGEPLLMGRSSNSSHHQLSANRLISRVHVRAIYHAPNDEHTSGRVFIECLGWNGVKVHCRGQIYDLAKGDTFSSDQPSADIMLDVQDTRVLLAWPFVRDRKRSVSVASDTTWEEATPTRRRAGSTAGFNSSPPPFAPQSPESLGPKASNSNDDTFLASDPADLEPPAVQVYEDGESGDDKARAALAESQSSRTACASAHEGKTSQTSASSFESDDFSDRDEENDPVVHSFGPFGANILSRMQSMSNVHSGTVSSQSRRRRPLKDPRSHPESPDGAQSSSDAPRTNSEPTPRINESPIKNHVINQLAFSRLHSMPLSTILGNLPAELRGESTDGARSRRAGKEAMLEEQAAESTARLTGSDLQQMLDAIACIGEITRVGKDASGRTLENEYYYVPEMDENHMRRDAVMGGIGGTGLRSVRKAHKQYYWKRPRY
ncbi:Protein PLM2 [Diplodia seriata]|uniref:Protein PLM2 n=1 Tax=Diplodia seriata TaxID=420778 RepID=A0A1S8B3T8_9PEZI|nr:Protein PLM2 [Diplodia seriata]